MNTLKTLINLFTKKETADVPLLIIKKDAGDNNIMEFNSIEEAIAELEKDPNVSLEKIENLKSSLKKLKNKTSIKIRNGEIIK